MTGHSKAIQVQRVRGLRRPELNRARLMTNLGCPNRENAFCTSKVLRVDRGQSSDDEILLS